MTIFFLTNQYLQILKQEHSLNAGLYQFDSHV